MMAPANNRVWKYFGVGVKAEIGWLRGKYISMTDNRQAATAALNGQQSDEELSVTKRQSRGRGDSQGYANII